MHIDQYQLPLRRLRHLNPQVLELFPIPEVDLADAWKKLDTRLLPLLEKRPPLMVAGCGGAHT